MHKTCNFSFCHNVFLFLSQVIHSIMEIFYFLTKYVQSRLLQICCKWERVKVGHRKIKGWWALPFEIISVLVEPKRSIQINIKIPIIFSIWPFYSIDYPLESRLSERSLKTPGILTSIPWETESLIVWLIVWCFTSF